MSLNYTISAVELRFDPATAALNIINTTSCGQIGSIAASDFPLALQASGDTYTITVNATPSGEHSESFSTSEINTLTVANSGVLGTIDLRDQRSFAYWWNLVGQTIYLGLANENEELTITYNNNTATTYYAEETA